MAVREKARSRGRSDWSESLRTSCCAVNLSLSVPYHFDPAAHIPTLPGGVGPQTGLASEAAGPEGLIRALGGTIAPSDLVFDEFEEE